MRLSSRIATIIFGISLAFFAFTRIWNITGTLEFFSDIGRDHYVILRAFQTHKPMLLGPGNGVLPFNQSAFYFYLNVPVFIVTGGSPYTTEITLTILFLAVFGYGYVVLRKQPRLLLLFSLLIFLMALQPQLMRQHRNPWNPTFTVPFLLLSLLSLVGEGLRIMKNRWLFAVGIAAALGCSYSVFPVSLVLLAYVLLARKVKLVSMLLPLLFSGVMVFLPSIVFELKSHFMMTKRLLVEIQTHEVGRTVNYIDKIPRLVMYLLGQANVDWKIAAVIVGLLSVGAVLCWRRRSQESSRRYLLFLILFIISFILTINSPFPLESHYIFGVLLFLLLAVVTMPKIVLWPTVFLLVFLWTPQVYAQLNFKPHRTISQLEVCVKNICSQEKEPLYASVQGWHYFHTAPEYLFFLNKDGCLARDVTQDPGTAQRMAVVSDSSQYTFGKTSFMELTLFGASKLDKTYHCDGNIDVYMLNK